MSFEDYLRDCYRAGKIDLALRVNVKTDNRVTFYIHPAGRDGLTLDYEVAENFLAPDRDIVNYLASEAVVTLDKDPDSA